MKIFNYILFFTAIFLIYYCYNNFKILKTKLNFNNIESFVTTADDPPDSGQQGTINTELRGGLVPIGGTSSVNLLPSDPVLNDDDEQGRQAGTVGDKKFGPGHPEVDELGTSHDRKTYDDLRKEAKTAYDDYSATVADALDDLAVALAAATSSYNTWDKYDKLEKCTDHKAEAIDKIGFDRDALIADSLEKWKDPAIRENTSWYLESNLDASHNAIDMEDKLSNYAVSVVDASGAVLAYVMRDATAKKMNLLTSDAAASFRAYESQKKNIDDATFLDTNGDAAEAGPDDLACGDDIEWRTDGKVWLSRKVYEDAMNAREQAQIAYNETLTEQQKLKYLWQAAERNYHDNERKIARNVLSNVQLNMVN